jgi:hypothetical protein
VERRNFNGFSHTDTPSNSLGSTTYNTRAIAAPI